MKIKVSFDPVEYKTKTEVEQNFSNINNRLASIKNHKYITTISELKLFADLVGNHGHAFSATNLDGMSREDINFEQIQLFALDFDNKPENQTTWKHEFARAEHYGLPVLFAYETLRSNENNRRFRMVFLNDGSINNKSAAEFIIKTLITIFPNSDQSCGNVLRMYFGGKNLFYFNEEVPTIDIEKIDIALGLYMKEKYGDHHKRELKKFATYAGILTNGNGMPDIQVHDNPDNFINGRILSSPFMYLNSDGKKLPKYYFINFGNDENNAVITKESGSQEEPKQKQPYSYHKDVRENDIPELRSKCELFRDFETGSRWLYHNELFGLATNIVHVDKGKELFLKALLNVLQNNPKYWTYKHKYAYFDRYGLSYIEKKYTNPQGCEKFCPYKEECDRAKNIISTVKVRQNEMEILVNHIPKFSRLTDAEVDFKNKFNMTMAANEHKMYVLKAQTALGKTEAYLQYMLASPKPLLIAAPTNVLKSDVYRRAVTKLGADEIKKHPEFSKLTGEDYDDKVNELGSRKVMMTPSLSEILSRDDSLKNPRLQEIRTDAQKLYDAGKGHKVMGMIKKIVKEENIPILRDYLEEAEVVRNFTGHMITTHGRMLKMTKNQLQNYEIIIDEDILKTIFSNKIQINVRNLEKKLYLCDRSDLAVAKLIAAVEYCRQASGNKEVLFELPKAECDRKTADMSWGFDIPAFCESEKFCCYYKDCYPYLAFIKPVVFEDLKYTVVSATVNKTVYDYYFGGGRVNFHECVIAEYIGRLIQDFSNTMSRSFVRDNPTVYSEIERALGKMERITFMEFAGADRLHFGATEGCDFLKGQNIKVIGTPHFPPWIYKLIAFTIGLDFDVNAQLNPQTVEHNGYRFKFMTYSDEVLRNIQFWLIEGELEQAVGRARLLRYDCTVYLFSNFPLRQARFEKFEFKSISKNNRRKEKLPLYV